MIDFCNRGGGAGVGVRVPHQALSPAPLELTEMEKHDLEAFLGALVDTVVVKRGSSATK